MKSATALLQDLFTWFARLRVFHLVVFGMVVRAIFCVWYVSNTDEPRFTPLRDPTFHDAGVEGYIQIAYNLIHHRSFSFDPDDQAVPFRAPIQPLLMTVFGAWSEDYWFVYWLAAAVLISGLYIWLAGRIGILLGVQSRWGRNLILFLTAVHPYLVFCTKTTNAIVTLVFLVTLIFYLFTSAASKNCRFAVACGGATGVACLTHPSFLLLPVVLGFLLLCYPRLSVKQRIARAAIVIFVPAIIVAPWTLRNYHAFGQFIPITSGAGLQYWVMEEIYQKRVTTAQAFQAIERDFESETGRPLRIFHEGIIDPGYDAILAKAAKDDMIDDPLKFLRRSLFGFYTYWAPADKGARKSNIIAILNLPVLLLLVVGVLIVLQLKKMDYNLGAALVFCFYFVGLFAAIQSVGAYFVMIMPVVLASLVASWSRISQASVLPATPFTSSSHAS